MKNSTLFTLIALVGLTWGSTQAATIYYVSPSGDDEDAGTSWTTAVKNLQVAINKASTGDEVWISAGTYRPTEFISGMESNPKARCFIAKNGVSLYGGFKGDEKSLIQRTYKERDGKNGLAGYEFEYQTILTGDLNGDDMWRANANGFYELAELEDNSYHVIWTSGEESGFSNPTIIDGLTLTGGTATHSDHPHKRGGGILLSRNITLQNCIVTQCAGIAGGGVSTLYGTVSECWIDKNVAADNGGGIANRKESMVKKSLISNNQIVNSNNSGEGAGVANYDQSSLIDCFIIGNRSSWFSGGVDNSNKVENCIIVDNYAAYYGGGIYNGAMMANCLVINNHSKDLGGGMYGTKNSENRNCTFANNTSNRAAAGTFLNATTTTINGIIWNNESIGGENNTSYTAYTGNTLAGMGNISLSAKENIFVTPSTFEGNSQTEAQREMLYKGIDFSLKPDARCINAGTSTGAPGTDIRGVSRPQGDGFDMGAYEYDGLTFIANTEAEGEEYTLINNIFTLLNGKYGAEITDVAGKTIGSHAASMGTIEIDLNPLPGGLYLIRSGHTGYKVIK